MRKKRKKTGRAILIFLIFIFILLLYWKLNEPEPDYSNVPLPTELNPIVKEKKDTLVQKAGDIGIRIVITEDFRSVEEQNRLYEQGRTTEGSIVTNAKGGESYHNYGLAIDFALLDINGVVIWDMNYDGNGNSKSDWMEVVDIAKALGFQWGGDWVNFKDYPHFQMDFGLTIQDLQKGKRPE
ncbi:M15 family metallopeptidase [Niallia sp. FSL W8-0635]|uniref:M15 family metallopeptidase n=1 Tax=Niallia sp. FSL W8-0635 TaxID=2975337 RepID=UPI0009CD8C02|nr:Peptidoglycan L-alanyl-D-glutamate endopeptidase CwlK precursor [Mycobacteroides abscessus subsp. abscessus]